MAAPIATSARQVRTGDADQAPLRRVRPDRARQGPRRGRHDARTCPSGAPHRPPSGGAVAPEQPRRARGPAVGRRTGRDAPDPHGRRAGRREAASCTTAPRSEALSGHARRRCRSRTPRGRRSRWLTTHGPRSGWSRRAACCTSSSRRSPSCTTRRRRGAGPDSLGTTARPGSRRQPPHQRRRGACVAPVLRAASPAARAAGRGVRRARQPAGDRRLPVARARCLPRVRRPDQVRAASAEPGESLGDYLMREKRRRSRSACRRDGSASASRGPTSSVRSSSRVGS